MNRLASLSIPILLAILSEWISSLLPVPNELKPFSWLAILSLSLIALLHLNHRWFIAYLKLYTVANIRGLWSGEALNRSLTRDYENSSRVDIKVTRGFGLFLESDGVFKKLILDRKSKEDRKVRILLHYPCLESDHLIRRAEANNKLPTDYVDDLFWVLRALFLHSRDPNNKETIIIRFYLSDKDSEWRFYVLEDDDGKKTLYFNHYNKSTSGAKSRMLKVLAGNYSLCDELVNTFNELFDNESHEIVTNHQNPLLSKSDLCGHPGCKEAITQSFQKHFRNG
ncbi:MAG: hypothetical protein E6Q88_01765 [Lysobacteraceae bacterium]|nr:MAG: hypothetical protein E6Q88_01765 [Xanthomonadaceae bacterium]